MGALDDAIREHLELKRKQGASDEEIAQQERAVLGASPPLTSPLPGAASPKEGNPAEGDHAGALEDAEPAGPAPDEIEHDHEGTHYVEPGEPAPEEIEPDEVLPEEALEVEPESTQAAMPLDDVAPARTDEEEALHYEGEDVMEESEDVLEETPDFLEETPEHDRLWFEQGPPKDFDFGD